VASTGPKGEQRVTRVLAVSDSDSYLKWSVATLRAMPASWTTTQLVIKNPVLPSAEQARAAAGAPVPVLSYPALLRTLQRERPDVLLLAATGPVVAALTAMPVLRGPDRPVLVSGLPGISVPATPRGITLRTGCDVFVLHSHREVAEFTALAGELGVPHDFGLATLPFLPPGPPAAGTARPADGPLLFAAQAKVPVRREDREQILLALAAAGPAVVKLRARSSEWQTHHEPWPYPQLYAGLVQAGRLEADALHFAAGSMTEALAGARGLVTVSSTAALEAMALGLPVLALSDFGVSEDMINTVFSGSGSLGTLADLAAGRLATADPAWTAANYFHPPTDNTWLSLISDKLAARSAGTLPGLPPVSGSRWVQARRRLRLTVPPELWRWVQPWRVRASRALGRTARVRPHGRPADSAPAAPLAGPPDERPRPPAASPPEPSGPDR
jgi:putative glycosyltransferase DUF6716